MYQYLCNFIATVIQPILVQLIYRGKGEICLICFFIDDLVTSKVSMTVIQSVL